MLPVCVCGVSASDGKALCLMLLDDDIPTNAMVALRSLPTLHEVAKIELSELRMNDLVQATRASLFAELIRYCCCSSTSAHCCV